MKKNQNNDDNFQDIVNRDLKGIASGNIENIHYIYPNGHRITHQMRWFKGSRDRGLSTDIAS